MAIESTEVISVADQLNALQEIITLAIPALDDEIGDISQTLLIFLKEQLAVVTVIKTKLSKLQMNPGNQFLKRDIDRKWLQVVDAIEENYRRLAIISHNFTNKETCLEIAKSLVDSLNTEPVSALQSPLAKQVARIAHTQITDGPAIASNEGIRGGERANAKVIHTTAKTAAIAMNVAGDVKENTVVS